MSLRLLPILTLLIASSALTYATQTRTQTFSMRGYPALGEPPQIRVLTPGTEPRVPLRYTIAPNHAARMNVRVSGWLSTTIQREGSVEEGRRGAPVNTTKRSDIPTVSMTFDVSAGSLAPNGITPLSIAFTGFDMAAGPEAGSFGAADGIFPLRTSGTLSDRGVIRVVPFDAPHPRLTQLVAQLTPSIENFTTPFPDEAVGAGARWEVRQAMAIAGPGLLRLIVFQKTDYEVVSITGGLVGLKYRVEQTAPRQQVDDALAGIGSADFEKMYGAGTGTVTVRLNSPVPTSEFTSHTSAWATNSSAKTAALSGYMRTAIAPVEEMAEPPKWSDSKALAGIRVVNLGGSVASRVGPQHVCYPTPKNSTPVLVVMTGLLDAATQRLNIGGIETSGRSTDFLGIDAQVRDASECSAVITLELRRGSSNSLRQILPDGKERQGGGILNPAVWRRSLVVSGAPSGFGARVIARFKDDVDEFVADVTRARSR